MAGFMIFTVIVWINLESLEGASIEGPSVIQLILVMSRRV